LERYTEEPIVSAGIPVEFQMSKRKAKTSKRAPQAVVRSPKHRRQRSVGSGSTESPPQRHNGAEKALLVESPVVENPVVENPATALPDDRTPTMTDNSSRKALEFSSVTANVPAFEAKLLEMAQANIQNAFEFAQRVAAIRSPVEFLSVNVEFTGKRMAMFLKHSKEMAELIAKR
jgi:Phasin protein